MTSGGAAGSSSATTTDAGDSDAANGGGLGASDTADGGVAAAGSGGSVVVPIPAVDGGIDGPTCGASSYEAQQIVVETEVDVPVEVTEEVPEEVTELVTTEVETTKPVVLYIMLDRSGSMGPGVAPLFNNLWGPAVTAVKNFVAADSSSGLGVALQYFPEEPKVSNECSTGAGYSTPAVAVGTLPDAVTGINASLDSHSYVSFANATTFGTPMEGALRGLTEFCKSYHGAHADTQCIGVLVTDGKPEYRSDCETSSTKLAKILSDAHTAGVTTFAVGLKGSDFTLLETLAIAGGAPECDSSTGKHACDVSSDASKLEDALASIREKVVVTETHTETHEVTHTVTHTEVHTEIVKEVKSVPLDCEWAIPETTDAFDRDKVNVRLTTASDATTFVRVSSKDNCRDDGWYFDDADNPTALIACDRACDRIKAAEDAKIGILLGCATLVPELF